jgi:2-oxoglutarate ferredoxin oxidoreductase subunit beta
MLKTQRDNAVTIEAAKKLTPEQLEGKFTIGVLHKSEAPEYTKQYEGVIARAQKGAK